MGRCGVSLRPGGVRSLPLQPSGGLVLHAALAREFARRSGETESSEARQQTPGDDVQSGDCGDPQNVSEVAKEASEVVEDEVSAATFALTEGDLMYLTGKTLRLLAAEHDCFLLFDSDGTPVLDSEFYVISREGITRID